MPQQSILQDQNAPMKSFRNNCSSCDKAIPSHELVIKTVGNVYHINCFTCVVCHCRLERGQDFALKENRLYCKEHFQQMEENIIKDQKQHNDNSSSEQSDNDTDSEGKKPTKRARTVLTSQQQSIFQSSFEISPKPCRKVREELSRETGLSVRVVQVWFQNQRAKVKKLARRDRFRSYNFSCYRGRYKYGKRSTEDKDDLNGYNIPLPMGQPETLPLPPMSHFTTCGSVLSPHQYSAAAPWHLGDTMDFLFPPHMKETRDNQHTLSTNVNNSDKEYQIAKERSTHNRPYS